MPQNIGLKIKMLRLKRGMTQKQLAHKADISLSYLVKIETGRNYPSMKTLARIAAALQVNIENLFQKGVLIVGEVINLSKPLAKDREQFLPLMKISDIARYLGVSRQHGYRFVKDNHIPTIRLSRCRIAVHRDDFFGFLESRKQKTEVN